MTSLPILITSVFFASSGETDFVYRRISRLAVFIYSLRASPILGGTTCIFGETEVLAEQPASALLASELADKS
ncbi:MAG: hypothetical protein IJE25_01435 [Clostridia bacterium]|nr:hypothetical protein [Clostridia bacterium]